jgi:hypothetical protein
MRLGRILQEWFWKVLQKILKKYEKLGNGIRERAGGFQGTI